MLGGKVVTFTTSYINSEGRENEIPITIVMVELDEGPWIMGNLFDIDPRTISMDLIGKRVKLGHKVFPGDKYSAGDSARPVFSFA
nr:OB-fold domain-containing protein [Desulfosporosinus sp. BICA1-9]